MNPATGTFTSMDTYGGSVFDPTSLHKYLYANANPVTYVDPSGNMSLPELTTAMTIGEMLEESAAFIVYSALIGAVSGFLLGTIDSLLGGNGIKQALIDGLKAAGWGALFGAVIGALMCFGTVYFSAVVALQAFRGIFVIFGIYGVYVSANSDNLGQAVFRAILTVFSFVGMGKAIDKVNGIRIKGTQSTPLPDSQQSSSSSSSGERTTAETSADASNKSTSSKSTSGSKEIPSPTDNHSTRTGRVGSLPAKNGPPNGSIDLYDEAGNLLQRRFYDESGNALLDVDFIHGNGDGTHVFPHFHDWDWTQKPPRLKWR